jgi:prepilin-type N-terminal cleavage/methylation domain-containing protein
MRSTGVENKPIHNEEGFSLIELLIALSILAIGMLAAASMNYSAVRNNTNGNVYTQANLLAKGLLESLKSQDIDSAALAPGDYSDPNPVDENGHPGGIYMRTWSIANYGSQSRQITVTVQWKTVVGGPRSVVMRSNTQGSGI